MENDRTKRKTWRANLPCISRLIWSLVRSFPDPAPWNRLVCSVCYKSPDNLNSHFVPRSSPYSCDSWCQWAQIRLLCRNKLSCYCRVAVVPDYRTTLFNQLLRPHYNIIGLFLVTYCKNKNRSELTWKRVKRPDYGVAINFARIYSRVVKLDVLDWQYPNVTSCKSKKFKCVRYMNRILDYRSWKMYVCAYEGLIEKPFMFQVAGMI